MRRCVYVTRKGNSVHTHNNAADKAPAAPAVPGKDTGNRRFLLFLAFFALSLNMRAPITSLPPVIHEIRDAFGISNAVAGLLTSIPVLCFGILTPFVGAAMKKFKLETSVFATLAGVLLGSMIRSAGGLSSAVAGTAVIGLALTAGNIATLMVIGRDFPRQASVMTGVLVCGMSVGSMGTMALTAPASHALGWRMGLALPVVPALAALVLWGILHLGRPAPCPRTGEGDRSRNHPGGLDQADPNPAVYRMPMVWLLAAAFAAHTFMFYGLTAWLPAYLIQSAGMTPSEAGMAASLFQILGLLGCFGIPLMATRGEVSTRVQFLTVSLSWIITTAGYLLAPGLWAVWSIFGGIASGGGFTVIFSLIMGYAKSLDQNRRISSLVQTAGYFVASLSPFVIGAIRETAHSWGPGMGLLTAAGVLMALCGLAACRQ